MTVALIVAVLLTLAAASRFGTCGVCVMCGGRGGHRSGCPKE